MNNNIKTLITDYLSANKNYLILTGFLVDEVEVFSDGSLSIRMERGGFGGDLEFLNIRQFDLTAWVYSKVKGE